MLQYRRLSALFFTVLTSLVALNAAPKKSISYVGGNTPATKTTTYVFRSPQINRLPQKTVDLFNTTLAMLRPWPRFKAKFIKRHKKLWLNGFTQEYKKSLTLDQKQKKGSYYDLLASLPEDVQKTVATLHADVLVQSQLWERVKAYVRQKMTWQNAVLAGLAAAGVGFGMYHYNQHKKRHKLGKAVARGRELIQARRDRRVDRNQEIFKRAMIDPEVPYETPDETGKMVPTTHVLFRHKDATKDKQFDEGARRIIEQIQASNLRYTGLPEGVAPALPSTWKKLDPDNRVFKDSETDLIIKLPRPMYFQHQPTFNLERVAGAFRVNHVAPTVWRGLVKGEVEGKKGAIALKGMKKKEHEALKGMSEKFNINSVYTRIIPLAGTVTPEQARIQGTHQSPIDDMHYVVIEEPLTLPKTTLFYDGADHEEYTPEQAHQIAHAGRYGGTSDMHNRNVYLDKTADGSWSGKAYDLEPLIEHTQRIFKINGNGFQPSRRQALRNLYHEATHGRDEHIASYLGLDREKEIASVATDALWQTKRELYGWGYAGWALKQDKVKKAVFMLDNPGQAITFGIGIPGQESWKTLNHDGERLDFLIRHNIVDRDALIDAYIAQKKWAPEKAAALKKFWDQIEPGRNYEERFTHPEITALYAD